MPRPSEGVRCSGWQYSLQNALDELRAADGITFERAQATNQYRLSVDEIR
jgi:hypothetical protein